MLTFCGPSYIVVSSYVVVQNISLTVSLITLHKDTPKYIFDSSSNLPVSLTMSLPFLFPHLGVMSVIYPVDVSVNLTAFEIF